MIKNDLKNDLKLKRFSFIKRIVSVLDSDWLSHVRSCCKLLYKPCKKCVAWQPLCCNTNCFWGTNVTLFGGRILFLLISLHFICSVLFCETLLCIWNNRFIKNKKPSKAVFYSEFLTAKGVLPMPLSCYKFTVNHSFLGLIALLNL